MAKDCPNRDRGQRPVRNNDRKPPARNAGGAPKKFSARKRNKIIAALDAEDSEDDDEEGPDDQGDSEEESEPESPAPSADPGEEQDFS